MTDKPILFDICCGLGGATKGYQRAGFHDWSWDRAQLVEAVPPDYYQFIGEMLMVHLSGYEPTLPGVAA